MDSDDPPPKKYDFKPRDFKRDNTPGVATPTAKELAIMSGHRDPAAPKPKAGPKANDPNDVYVVLERNRALEKEKGLGEVEIRKVKSRRKRDFVLLLLGGNLAIIGLVAITGFNPVSVIFGFAGVVVFSLALTWIMWQVMGKY